MNALIKLDIWFQGWKKDNFYTRQEVKICKNKTTKMSAPLFGLHIDEVVSKKKLSERQRREPTNFIKWNKILRFYQQFSENYVFGGKFDTRQPGKWLRIHTLESKISLAMASVASAYFHPCWYSQPS